MGLRGESRCVDPFAGVLTKVRQGRVRFWAKNGGGVRNRVGGDSEKFGKLGKLCGLGCAHFGQRLSKSGKKLEEVGSFWGEVGTFWVTFGRFWGVFEG